MNNSKHKESAKLFDTKYQTVRQIVLNLESENRIEYDISHRGGTYGAASGDVVAALFPTLSDRTALMIDNWLPNKVGVHCNYLGGGLRGSINRSDFSKDMPAKYAKRIDSFTRECKNRYLAIENGEGLNDEEYPDGDTNWDAIGTNRSRAAGVKSAY